jgi:hypothetical protein
VKRALLVLAACGAAPRATAPLALQASAPIDAHATAVIEQGDALYVLEGNVALIVRGGIVTTRIESPRPWAGGASIVAPDGDGRWVIAFDDEGVPWRLTLSGEREPVAERLGLGGAKVHALGGAGATFAADLGDAVAFTTDGVHLARVPVGESYRFAVARGVLARAVKGTQAGPPHLERWDLSRGTRVTYAIAPADIAFLDGDTDHARLVAITDDRMWIESDGRLAPFAVPALGHDVVARGDRLWIGAAGELYAFDGRQLVPTRHDDHQVSLLAASTAGDAWLSTERGLVRYSLGATAADPAWQAQVAPVFQRVCAHCHLPGGEAGIDLSTPAAWHAERGEIARRVLATRTMPPAGTELGDADRAALASWLNAR